MDQRTPAPARPDVGAPDYDDLFVFLERHEDGFDAECAHCLNGDPLEDRVGVLEERIDSLLSRLATSTEMLMVGCDRLLFASPR